MRKLPIGKAFTLIEPGPVVLVATHDGKKHNIMTISWTMVLDFTPVFAMTTGPWNHSFAALRETRECVIAVPTVDMLDQVVGVGTCSGADTDKFGKFRLTPVKGTHVHAPLIKECLANIECRVVDIVRKHSIVVLEGVAAYVDASRKETRTIHAVGDGTFIVDGRKLDRRDMMRLKIPEGLRSRDHSTESTDSPGRALPPFQAGGRRPVEARQSPGVRSSPEVANLKSISRFSRGTCASWRSENP